MRFKLLISIFILTVAVGFSYLFYHIVLAGLVSNFSDQLSSQVIASAADHTISFTVSADLAPGETLELYFQPDFDLSLIDYTDIDLQDDTVDLNLGTTPGNGSGSNIGVVVAGQTITFTQNDTDTVTAGSEITIKIGTNADHQLKGEQQIYNPTIAGSYKISMAGSFGDTGTLSVAVLETDTVALQAEINPEISFSLRNEADTDYTNSCDLGTISSFGISQCSYRLAAETNAVKGFQIYVKVDGNFRNTNDFIANISEDTQVVQGSEGYGLAVYAGNNLLPQNDFTDNDTPLSTAETLLIKANSVYNYIQGELSTSTLIIHKASINATTPAGIYNQQILYTVLANY